MAFETNNENDHNIVLVDEPRLDAAIAESFKTYLFEQLDAGAGNLIVDLSQVRFMDSSGLGALVAALKKASNKEALKLAAPQPAVQDLFDLTSMGKLFTITDSVDAAKGA